MNEWISVEEKLPHDLWKDKGFDYDIDQFIDDFIVQVETNDHNDDPEVTIAEYTKVDGWLYTFDWVTKYNGKPWRVTRWMEKPEPKR